MCVLVLQSVHYVGQEWNADPRKSLISAETVAHVVQNRISGRQKKKKNTKHLATSNSWSCAPTSPDSWTRPRDTWTPQLEEWAPLTQRGQVYPFWEPWPRSFRGLAISTEIMFFNVQWSAIDCTWEWEIWRKNCTQICSLNEGFFMLFTNLLSLILVHCGLHILLLTSSWFLCLQYIYNAKTDFCNKATVLELNHSKSY